MVIFVHIDHFGITKVSFSLENTYQSRSIWFIFGGGTDNIYTKWQNQVTKFLFFVFLHVVRLL
jgi:hypothetical protein